MKLIFAGTPEFAADALRSILLAGHQVVLALTQPDRPSGRGLALRQSPVKQLALECGIEVLQPSTLKDDAILKQLGATGADAMVVAAYGLILPQGVLDMPPFGCLNIHASLLPRWRGAAPIQRAILAGDEKTGVCIMQMEAGLDTGPVLLSGELDIGSEDTAGLLHDKLAKLGARLIVDALGKLPLVPSPQPETGETYAAKIEKSEARLDWRHPAKQIARQVRAFNPYPGALAHLNGEAIKIWKAEVEPASGKPGTILSSGRNGIVVACGENGLKLLELQKAGGKHLPVTQFLAGTPVIPGTIFDLPT